LAEGITSTNCSNQVDLGTTLRNQQRNRSNCRNRVHLRTCPRRHNQGCWLGEEKKLDPNPYLGGTADQEKGGGVNGEEMAASGVQNPRRLAACLSFFRVPSLWWGRRYTSRSGLISVAVSGWARHCAKRACIAHFILRRTFCMEKGTAECGSSEHYQKQSIMTLEC
jgi:hypothetical protein